jgi:hypothetical protein
MDKERLIKRIEENFDDMEDALIKNYHLHYVQLFRDYTEEIIKIIEEETVLEARFSREMR